MGLTLFMILAVIAVLSAFAVVFNRNVVHSALALLLNFSSLAAFYFMLNAQFLGVVQILVYAGAIVVLFLFVVMLLGSDLGEEVTTWFTVRNGVMVVLALVLLTVIGTVVRDPQVAETAGKTGTLTQEAVQQFGQAEMIGMFLFTDFILPFHLVAVLLSVGVVGILWLAQQVKKKTAGESR
ncbi:MAG: NADH-quinone oxidoreductase subunit J [Anaerolineae bacterium]|nr:NADH-quinone oxidoreductase subunit J [Anaerolineae bacterium]